MTDHGKWQDDVEAWQAHYGARDGFYAALHAAEQRTARVPAVPGPYRPLTPLFEDSEQAHRYLTSQAGGNYTAAEAWDAVRGAMAVEGGVYRSLAGHDVAYVTEDRPGGRHLGYVITPKQPAAGEPPHTASAGRWRDWHLRQVAAIARDPAVSDAQAGGRIRALLFPAHDHDGDGTAEGCPGCFPPGEVIRDPHDPRAIIAHAPEELDELLHAIETVDRWLDGDVAEAYRDQPLAQDWARVAKTGEEDHEAIAALIAMTGQNPRKGTCGTRGELLAELADAAVTRLFAIQHFTKDVAATWAVFTQAVAKAYGRAPEEVRSCPTS